MNVVRGNPVTIILAWPQQMSVVNSLLRDAFKLIRDRKLVDCVELSNVMYIHTRGQSKKKWYREQYGVETELIAELISQKDIRVETITETRVTKQIKDLVTGVTMERVEEFKTVDVKDGRVLGTKTWLELSRQSAEFIESLPDPEPQPEEASVVTG